MRKNYMFKQLVLTAVALLLCCSFLLGQTARKSILGNGIRAIGSPFEYKQKDGSTVTIKLFGDKVIHWARTTDDYAVIAGSDGNYNYAISDKSGNLVNSGIMAHNPTNRGSLENNFLAGISANLQLSETAIQNKIAQFRNLNRGIQAGFPTTGTPKFLVILMGFPDQPYTYTQSNFDNMLNQPNYNGTGSFKDYYSVNSHGKLNVQTTVVGPFMAANPMDYYGANDAQGNDVNPVELVSEAITAAANSGVDFSTFDNNSDGVVDALYMIFAGYGEAGGGPAISIWPHAGGLNPTITYNGVSIERYACSAELGGGSGGIQSGIGTLCHEFGHSLGLPDYYDTDYAGSGGQSFDPGSWDLMAGGNYNNGENTPAGHNPFSKYFLGWCTPKEITADGTITLPNSMEDSLTYMINSATTDESFIFDNRQLVGFDAALPGHGMLIYHLDGAYVSAHLATNNINNDPLHNGWDVLEADNIQDQSSLSGDVFPGTASITIFNDNSTPGSLSWANQATNKPIINIAEDVNGIITFNISGFSANAVDFIGTPTTVAVGGTVTFTDQSTNSPISWTWTFGDGGVSTSQNPTHVYNTTGIYSVSLTATNASGTNTAIKNNYITVGSATTPCSGTTILTSSSGSFSDGSGATNYLPNSNCKWLIQPAGATAITLVFTSFATESGYDIFRAYDGSDSLATLIGEFSGTTLPSSVTSSGGVMFVQFISDYDVNDAGWDASYSPATGISRVKEIENMAIIPNPNNGVFSISFGLLNKAEVEVEIINILGETIWKENKKVNANQYTNEINLGSNKSGIYMLKVVTNGKTYQQRIVIE